MKNNIKIEDHYHILEFGAFQKLHELLKEITNEYDQHKIMGLPIAKAIIDKRIAETRCEIFRLNTMLLVEKGCDVSRIDVASIESIDGEFHVVWEE